MPVVVSDVSTYRLGLAEQLGAIGVCLGETSLGDGLREHHIVPDVAFDSWGRDAARRDLLDALSKRGVLVCVGHGRSLNLKVSPDLIATERTIMGSEYLAFGEIDANLRA